ncbi:MAG: hypothetical protein MUC88_14070 [Planctomycetes bacterium]|nr:hypothetical protein [Planctomycetota bacterium]
MKPFPTSLVLATGLLLTLSAGDAAAAEVALLYRGGVPQVAFAAAEIVAAVQAKGDTVVKGAPEGVGNASQSLRIILAFAGDDTGRWATDLGVAPFTSMGSQSYALRRKVEGARTTYVVLGADPPGCPDGPERQ